MATEVGSALNWGIASAGLISHDFVTAISTKPDQHKVVAVAARSVDRAKEFASKHGISSHYGSYKDLASDPAVQVGIYTTGDCRDGYIYLVLAIKVVYVGSIASTHMEISLMMIRAGKHVLCEKSLCTSIKETKELIQEARAANVFLMEAVWSR